MTSMPFHVELDPAGAIDVPPAGTLSRTLYADDDLRVVVFGFSEGEELTEHTSSRPAVIQVLRGEFELTLAGESVTAREGAWVHMEAGLRHAVVARSAAVLLLTLVGRAQPPAAG
jgi:quercetin dioxygenase-like cupin family protein